MESARLASDHQPRQAHREVRGHAISERCRRPGNVQVRASAIVSEYLRDGAGLREQAVDLGDCALLVTFLAAGDDRVEPGSIVARSVEIAGLSPDAGKRILVGHRLKVDELPQLVTIGAAARIDELDAASHRLDLVSIKVTLTAVAAAN
jgi:hypothetical protein